MSESFNHRKQAHAHAQPGTGGHGRDFRRGELMELNMALDAFIERRGLRTPMENLIRAAIQKKNADRAAERRARK